MPKLGENIHRSLWDLGAIKNSTGENRENGGGIYLLGIGLFPTGR
jgi:hypothetical protein